MEELQCEWKNWFKYIYNNIIFFLENQINNIKNIININNYNTTPFKTKWYKLPH